LKQWFIAAIEMLQFDNMQSPNECPDWQLAIVNGPAPIGNLAIGNGRAFALPQLARRPANRIRFPT
jgi:hypothetical protein